MHPSTRRVWVWIVAALVVALVIVRLFLPSILRHEINHRLARIPGYTGHVASVGVKLWHGGYSMQDLVIEKKDANGRTEPFVAADDISFTVAYRKLIHGQLVSDISIERGTINFVASSAPQQNQNLGIQKQAPGKAPKPDQRWQNVVQDLFPIDITHLELHDSRIRFQDESAKPKVDLSLNHLELQADNLRDRVEKGGDPLPAKINLHGDTIGNGHLVMYLAAEPLADKPHFTLDLSLTNVFLPALNDFLLAYASVDVSQGQFQLYGQVQGQNGSYQGYLKPFLTNLNFKTASDDRKNVFQQLWKDLVAATTKLLRDKQHKQVATIIPFSGQFETGTDVRVLTTIGNLLRNGFIQAIRRGLEGSAKATTEKNQPPAPAAATQASG